MKYVRCLLLLLSICCTLNLHGQEKEVITFGKFFAKKAGGAVFLKGVVKDPESGKPIEGASVRIDSLNMGTKTDAKGAYGLIMPIGEYTVEVSHPEMKSIQQKIIIYDDGILDFGLGSRAYSLREVVIESTIDNENVSSTAAGVNKLQIKEIKSLPAFLGEVDVIKSLLLLPGVSTVGEGSSGFNV